MGATDEERAAYEARVAAYWGRTALYRLYGEADRLLYVGIAMDPEVRWRQHRKDKHWWPQVVRHSVSWFDHRTEALEAERAAIRTEKPVHNGTHSVVKAPERIHGSGGRVISTGRYQVTVESFPMSAAAANLAWATEVANRSRWELGELPITFLTNRGQPTLVLLPPWLGKWIEANADEILASLGVPEQ